jgi:FtsP/CotA-like multicopper oxidase with cupredoxin domain
MSQYVDGLVGALIIEDPSATSPLPYDQEIVIPLSDWYHTDSEALLEHYLSRASKGEEVKKTLALFGREYFK